MGESADPWHEYRKIRNLKLSVLVAGLLIVSVVGSRFNNGVLPVLIVCGILGVRVVLRRNLADEFSLSEMWETVFHEKVAKSVCPAMPPLRLAEVFVARKGRKLRCPTVDRPTRRLTSANVW